jgi:hypothetical protein
VSITWTIAAETELGEHTVELTGADSERVAAATFEVIEAQDGGLSPSGGSVAGLVTGSALLTLLAGGGLIVALRRRATRIGGNR